jgi:hypothetical protein
MAKNINLLNKQLQELSKTINSFKSEAVQLKIIDTVFKDLSLLTGTEEKVISSKPKAIKIAKPKKIKATKTVKPLKAVVTNSKLSKAKTEGKPAKPVANKPVVAKIQKPVEKAEKKAKVKPSAIKGPGATATINKLFATGYFASKRNMGEIVKHINEELKLAYKITALSGLVNKLVKDKKLSRVINPVSNKFEYFNA